MLVAHFGLRPGDRVAEIGAGTGLFTRALAGHGLDIVAIEPNEDMRAHAPSLPGVVWQNGTFESTGLPSGSRRWVAAAQSLHWAHAEQALPEIRRVLEPRGWLTVVGNSALVAREPLLTWTLAAIRRHVPSYTFPYRGMPVLRLAARASSALPLAGQRMLNGSLRRIAGAERAGRAALIQSTGDFGRVVFHEMEHRVTMSAEQYRDLWHTYDRVTAEPRGFDAFMRELTEHLSSHGIETIELPYVCVAWSAQARG